MRHALPAPVAEAGSAGNGAVFVLHEYGSAHLECQSGSERRISQIVPQRRVGEAANHASLILGERRHTKCRASLHQSATRTALRRRGVLLAHRSILWSAVFDCRHSDTPLLGSSRKRGESWKRPAAMADHADHNVPIDAATQVWLRRVIHRAGTAQDPASGYSQRRCRGDDGGPE